MIPRPTRRIMAVAVAVAASISLTSCPDEGNNPPTASFEVTVSGAGTTAANGTYVWDPSAGVYGAYVLPGATTYYIFSSGSECTWNWYLGDSADGSGTELYGNSSNSQPVPSSGWTLIAGLAAVPTMSSTGDGIRGSYDGGTVGNVVNVVYIFQDQESDADAGADYLWQKTADIGNAPDNSAWSEVGTNSDSYTMDGSEHNGWLRVIVTPHAAAGLLDGQSVTSPPILLTNSGC